MKKLFALIIISVTFIFSQENSDLNDLASQFFKWRKTTQPIGSDDIPRIERGNKWVPDYSPQAIRYSQIKYKHFKSSLQLIPHTTWTRADSVDYLLLRSAIERVNWELNILKLTSSHPEFYLNQTIGCVFDLLVISSPFTKVRAENLILRLNSIPRTLQFAKINLTDPIKPFAQITINQLEGINEKIETMAASLKSSFPELWGTDLGVSASQASAALEDYSLWLKIQLPAMKENFAVGRSNYNYFLKFIALVPYTLEELLLMGKQEQERAVAFETLEIAANKNIPRSSKFNSIDHEISQAQKDELAIRDFLAEKNILTIPKGTRHYTLKAMPDYIKALSSFGELDDFTSPSRLQENSVRYIPDPSEKLGFFYGTAAHDPRPLIIHEGLPGHYFQLIQAWQNPRLIRRFYIDSNANEGIGFYLEEMMLQLGLFQDKPHTREIIYRFMRLRALRVAVDINLAVGNLTIKDAGIYLAATVPMDPESAAAEAAFFAAAPGQAITYQIGKIQILKLISDGKIKLGQNFNLKDYHDYMMLNGNVPISLQRWEFLGENDEIDRLW